MAQTILNTIADYARLRVEEDKKQIPLSEMKSLASQMPKSDRKSFRESLSGDGMHFICEVKKASPSKGIISEDFPYLDIAQEYEAAGADCISCLTEPKWFMGSDSIFREIRDKVKIPMLRKDFVVDEYQIYQAKTIGADCVLLICSLLDTETVHRYLGICRELGLDALVETHDENEISSAVSAGAEIIGVNNRNLKDFSVDFTNASRLRRLIPDRAVYVAESGVRNSDDVKRIYEAGADAVLIGEALMRAEEKTAVLRSFREACI